MRKVIQSIIQVILAVAVLAGGVAIAKKLAGGKAALPKNNQVTESTVFFKTVENRDVPVMVKATGALLALERVTLFSEVQGVMLPDGGKFKAGNAFNSGQSLVSIQDSDFRASLMSQKSNLQSLITAALADIRMDYPESFDNWKNYLDAFDVNQTLKPLPAPASEKEKLFITGRNIQTTYYQIKNAELVLSKYHLSAPFSGVLTEATVTPGTVIRPGQKLGTLIKPGIYEMETPINSAVVDQLKIGQKVTVNATDNSNRSWVGDVIRINRLVDPTTQTMNAYIRLSGEGLEEGMYLEGDISATSIANAIELPREVLFEDDQIYIVRDNELVQTTVDPVYFTEKTVIVRGLENGTGALVKMPPSAYPGMRVKLDGATKKPIEAKADSTSSN